MSHGRLDFINELRWRGLINQTTGDDQLTKFLSTPGKRAYVGFDPTADSLTIGNLIGLMVLVRFALSGHQPIILSGGGTGLIGDPSGKSKERELNTADKVRANVVGQRRIFDALWANAENVTGASLGPPPVVNNVDWLSKIGYLEALRDIGKYFSVNMMIQKDSVKERLNNRDQGISYTEFSYMILQAYDFYFLHRESGVEVQMGGSDQWGNIICGIDLIKRHVAEDAEAKGLVEPPHVNAYGLTWPLVTKADGGKFGKTETGAIWLTADRTSPYAFYQFWLNSSDADIPKFLRNFTLIPRERVEELEASHAANPGAREAHRELARHMTTLLHGSREMQLAEDAGKALFSGEIGTLPEATLREVLSSVPSSQHPKSLLSGEGAPILELLVETQLAKSKTEAREFLTNGSVTVNGSKVTATDRLTSANLLHGSMIAIRRGKKNWHLTNWA